MKKILSVLLSIMMIISSFAFTTEAFAGTIASGQCGKDAYFTLDDKGTLTISGTGSLWDGEYSDSLLSNQLDSNCEKVKSIIIKDGITIFPRYALDDLYYVKTISIPSTITKLASDRYEGEFSFYSDLLSSINVNKNNKYFYSVGGVLFNKSKTKLIKYPNNKTNTSYTIPKTVTTISDYAFSKTKSLKNVSFSSKVKIIGNNAFGSSGIKEIKIPNSVTTIGNSAFEGCYNLTKATIGNGLTVISNAAFSDDEKLNTVVIGKNVKTIEAAAFFNCPKLKSVYIPSSVKKIGIQAFSFGYSDTDDNFIRLKGFKIYSKGNKAAKSYAKKNKLTHVTVKSVPKLTFKSVSPVSKGFKATWKKNTKMHGYQIQYATDSKFTKNVKTVTVTNEKSASKTITKLEGNKKYYVRIRNYKRYAGYIVGSAWSKAKAVTTKK